MKLRFIIMLVLLCLCSNVLAKEVVGWVEKIFLTHDNILVKAKIDSGARHSSLNCDCKSTINDKGERWVHLKFTSYKGESLALDKKVIRQAVIKRHNGKSQIREVIKLNICLGTVRKEVEVNLIDRSGLNYQLLIGRSFLKGDFLIDPGKMYINKPKCELNFES